ncbi:MAG: oligosaccharide flippase family protein [Pseudomonadota bacterium]
MSDQSPPISVSGQSSNDKAITVGTGTTGSSSVWLIAARIVAQITNLILLLIAARVLSPAELGAFALTSAVGMILLQCAETGWYQYISSQPEKNALHPTVFWLGTFSGLAWVSLGLLAALMIWLGWHAPNYALVMVLLSSLGFFAAVTSLQFGVIMRRGNVTRISQIGIASELLGFSIGAVALLAGAGVFALAFHKTLTHLTTSVLSVAIARWLPAFDMTWSKVREILTFVRELLLGRTGGLVQNYSSDFLVGALLGAAEVGYYRAGIRFVGAVNEVLTEPLRVLAWTVLPKATEQTPSHTTSQRSQTLEDFVLIISAVALPCYVGMAMVAKDLIVVLLGPGWGPAVTVMVIFCAVRLLLSLRALVEPVLSLGNALSVLPRFVVLSMILSIGLFLAIGHRGLMEAALSQAIAAILLLPVIILIFMKYGNLNIRSVITSLLGPVFAVLAMTGALLYLNNLLWIADLQPIARLPILVLAGASAYAIALFCIARDTIRNAFDRINAL